MKHTCIMDDGGTPNRTCEACREEFVQTFLEEATRYWDSIRESHPLCILDVAKYFGVSKECVRRWIKKGQLAALPMPGMYRISHAALKAAS